MHGELVLMLTSLIAQSEKMLQLSSIFEKLSEAGENVHPLAKLTYQKMKAADFFSRAQDWHERLTQMRNDVLASAAAGTPEDDAVAVFSDQMTALASERENLAASRFMAEAQRELAELN